MHARFYAPDAHVGGDLVTLAPDEARHLTTVLRLGAGDTVRVFNGRGGQFEGRVETVGRVAVRVRLGAVVGAAPEAHVAVILAQAVLKGDKMDAVVRDAVMIGVAAIQPIVTDHVEVSLPVLERSHRRERWERIAVASTKQCGRAVLPPVLAPVSLDTLCRGLTAGTSGPALMLVEPGVVLAAEPLGNLDGTPPAHATILVGPEGGWSSADLAAAVGCRCVSLGPRTLRADAMALVAVAALFARWNEF